MSNLSKWIYTSRGGNGDLRRCEAIVELPISSRPLEVGIHFEREDGALMGGRQMLSVAWGRQCRLMGRLERRASSRSKAGDEAPGRSWLFFGVDGRWRGDPTAVPTVSFSSLTS